jgi:hypothetical protein
MRKNPGRIINDTPTTRWDKNVVCNPSPKLAQINNSLSRDSWPHMVLARCETQSGHTQHLCLQDRYNGLAHIRRRAWGRAAPGLPRRENRWHAWTPADAPQEFRPTTSGRRAGLPAASGLRSPGGSSGCCPGAPAPSGPTRPVSAFSPCETRRHEREGMVTPRAGPAQPRVGVFTLQRTMSGHDSTFPSRAELQPTVHDDSFRLSSLTTSRRATRLKDAMVSKFGRHAQRSRLDLKSA